MADDTQTTDADMMYVRLRGEPAVRRVDRVDRRTIEFEKDGELTPGLIDRIGADGWAVRKVSPRSPRGDLTVTVVRGA